MANLEPWQREALVDHELSHCGQDEEGNWVIWSHDVKEFSGVIARHGLWMPNVQQFAQVAARKVRQIDLFEQEPVEARAHAS